MEIILPEKYLLARIYNILFVTLANKHKTEVVIDKFYRWKEVCTEPKDHYKGNNPELICNSMNLNTNEFWVNIFKDTFHCNATDSSCTYSTPQGKGCSLCISNFKNGENKLNMCLILLSASVYM